MPGLPQLVQYFSVAFIFLKNSFSWKIQFQFFKDNYNSIMYMYLIFIIVLQMVDN